MICVQANEHIVFFRKAMRSFGEDQCSEDGVLDVEPRCEFTGTG